MRIVEKFDLSSGETMLMLPKDAKPIHIAEQCGQLQMWVECDQNASRIARYFRGFYTGDIIYEPDTYEYVGSALMENNTYAFHIYEIRNSET